MRAYIEILIGLVAGVMAVRYLIERYGKMTVIPFIERPDKLYVPAAYVQVICPTG